MHLLDRQATTTPDCHAWRLRPPLAANVPSHPAGWQGLKRISHPGRLSGCSIRAASTPHGTTGAIAGIMVPSAERGVRARIVDFEHAIRTICTRFDTAEVHYGLIGGLAMAMRGVQRATVDLDFLLLLEDLEEADAILRDCGYRREFHTDNVSHYRSPEESMGRVDVLHAFRGPSLGMLERAERLDIGADLALPVLRTEDLVGLKVQAAVNDATRASADWQDIEMLLRASTQQGCELDWDLIGDYLDIFDQSHRLEEMRRWHDKTD